MTGSIAELRGRLSRVAFAKRFLPELDPWQEDLLRSNAKRVLIAAARQSGKTTICAILALHQILYYPGSLVVVVSRTVTQSGELARKVLGYYRQLGSPVEAVAERQLSLDLANGSRLVTLPGSADSVRGFSGAALILLDEAARVDDELITAVTPMVSVSGGRLIMLSSPAGPSGRFASAWIDGATGWERYRTTAFENPRISREFLETERRHMTPDEFAAEYEAQFIHDQSALFQPWMLAGAIDDTVREVPELEEMAWNQ